MDIITPKGNKAIVNYSFDGIPTDGLFPLYQGYTIKNRVVIQPHLEHDKGLLAHELTHVDQWYSYYWFSFRYKHHKNFRFRMEAEAFANQVAVNQNKNMIGSYAHELSTAYGLKKTSSECAAGIIEYYQKINGRIV